MSNNMTIDEYIEMAVLNHYRLVEENKRLREMVKSLSDECVIFLNEFGQPSSGDYEAVFVDAHYLLSELESKK